MMLERNSVKEMFEDFTKMQKRYGEAMERDGKIIKSLQAENAALKARLENAVELPLPDIGYCFVKTMGDGKTYYKIKTRPIKQGVISWGSDGFSVPCPEPLDSIGKTVFLTRQAAEEALGGINGK